VQNGRPVANAEMGLSTHSRLSGEALPEVRIGTGEDGKFAITNVPPSRVWYLYGRMESLAPRGLAAAIVECATRNDRQEINVGDVPVQSAFALRGKIVLSDGKPIPPGMRVNLSAGSVPDSQTLTLAPDGLFEFKGLARAVYRLTPSVKGYEPRDPPAMELLMEGDVSNMEVLLQPAAALNR
jgi:hypothetical protein